MKTDKREDLFAATPPLEALKLLISMAMTEGIGFQKGREEQGMKLEFIDIRHTFRHRPEGYCMFNYLMRMQKQVNAPG